MSKLSELLNPVPSSSTASGTAPEPPTMASIPALGAEYHNSSPLRPNSSHRSPPLPLDLPRQSEGSLGGFASGLEKYHHASSDEVRNRRLSDLADGMLQTLAPLIKSLSDENTKISLPQLEPAHDDPNHWGRGKILIDPGQESSDKQQREQDQGLDENREACETSQAEPEPIYPQSIPQPSEKGLDEIQVKAEIIDSMSGVLQDNPNDCVGTNPHHEASSRLDEPMRDPTPRADADANPAARDQATKTEPENSSPYTPIISKPIPPKKTVVSKSKVEKKGTASAVKSPAKRRKIEPDSAIGTPSAYRSGTPASSRASKTPAPRNRKRNSITPARSSSLAVANETEDDEDAEVFCVCRKPDDHTWMIACDGPCEDWFHGKCVDMNEKDGNLIDKYICEGDLSHRSWNDGLIALLGPNCQANGVGHTTWKPMCRLESCRNPARVTGPKPSKYCSNEHGIEYMRSHATKQDNEAQARAASNKRKKIRRDNYTDHFGNGNVEDTAELDDDRSHLRGGVLRSRELKALADGVQDISGFRKLGDGVLSPPRTASPDANGHTAASKVIISCTPEEHTQLREISSKEDGLKRRRTMLNHRDRFLVLVRARAKRVLEHLRKKEPVKDICGFDARLSWSDEEFQAWCASPEGTQSLESGNLCAPPSKNSATNSTIRPIEPSDGTLLPLDYDPSANPASTKERSADGVVVGQRGTETKDEDEEEELGRGVCQKRRCERHKTWWKLQLQDVAFERDEVRQALERLEVEEKHVRKRALIRGLEDDERVDGDGDGDGDVEEDGPRRMLVDRVSSEITDRHHDHDQREEEREREGDGDDDDRGVL